MKDLERRIAKLEQSNSGNREEIMKLVDEQDIHPLEKFGILSDLGLVDGETIAKLIAEGYERNKTELENEDEE